MSYPIVLIEWEDSAQPTSAWQWLSLCKMFSTVRCQSIGWLVHDSDDVKALVSNVGDFDGNDDDRQVSGLIRIPTRCIINVTVIKEAD